MRRKKGLGYEALVRLTISIVILVSVFFITRDLVAGIFRVTAGVEESFKEFVKLVEDVGQKEEGEFRVMSLVMDERSGIIGFAKGTEQINFVNFVSGDNVWRSVFQRPEICDLGQACLCLCRGEFEQTETIDTAKVPMPMHCDGSLICEQIVNVDFLKSLTNKQLKARELFKGYNFKGGFHFKRGTGNKFTSDVRDRRTQVFAEKGAGDIVAICFNARPCS